ncbi:MAG: mitochondrial fission ELM1 family protein [Acidocella sp.]|nr:mitochondrial fission ELM1 family protein [Acidocella sp.]
MSRIFATDLAGLRTQALGLAEAAGLEPDLYTLVPRPPWDRLSPAFWAWPRLAVGEAPFRGPLPPLVMGVGGAGARVAAALRGPDVRAVAIQHPRMALAKFDLVFAARHDGISGPNVVITRTALHGVTPARLAAAKAVWMPRFAGQARPLVAVLLGGANGRYRFGVAEAKALAASLAEMMRRDHVGLVITPSRRTAPEVVTILRHALGGLGAWIWDGAGDNPYFGMLACADAIIVTADSVSMVSEAVATNVPVYLVRLPGRSARIGAFMQALVNDGRVRDFAGRLALWDTSPVNDTAMAAAMLRRRMGLENA